MDGRLTRRSGPIYRAKADKRPGSVACLARHSFVCIRVFYLVFCATTALHKLVSFCFLWSDGVSDALRIWHASRVTTRVMDTGVWKDRGRARNTHARETSSRENGWTVISAGSGGWDRHRVTGTLAFDT